MARIYQVGLAVAVAALCSTPASAQCPGISQPLATALGAFITDCADNGPVAGFAYALGSTANTGSANIICEFEGEAAQGATGCFGSGGPGDGMVTIDANWGNPGVSGCPNPSGAQGVGRNVVVIRDNVGGGVILSVGYDTAFGGYIAEYAFNGDLARSCREGTGAASSAVHIRGVTKGGDTVTTTATVDAQAIAPRVFSDCDPDSAGQLFGTGTCTEGTLSFARGSLYYQAADCEARNLNMSRGSWTPVATAADGSATFTASYPSALCLFVGSSLNSGTEGPAIVSATAVTGNLAASPKALGVRAKHAGGEVVVDFYTISEVGLVGFEVETKSGRRIGTLIAGKGVDGGGASYSVSFKRGDFKSEKELYVVAVTGSSRTKSDLVSF